MSIAIGFSLDQSKILLCRNGLMILKKQSFENIVGKGENAGSQHFLLLQQCFLIYQEEKSSF